MLKANKSLRFEKVFSIYNRNLLRRRFHVFRILGLENLSNRERKIPNIIYCNHTSWWDGLAAFQISQKADLEAFLMMEEKQLKNLRLFRKLGAFSVVRENPREALKSINYSVKILKEKTDRAIWIFPQGEILPNDLRPVKFYNGISRIIEKIGKCQIFCVAVRYEFLGEFKPEIFVSLEKAEIIKAGVGFDSKSFTLKLAANLENNLDNLKNRIIKNDINEFQNII